jgi:type 1 glutamine amidotransferase
MQNFSQPTQHTVVVDGFRWAYGRSSHFPYFGSLVYHAQAQQRCTTDSGRVYFANVGPRAEFDSPEARERFFRGFTASAWAAPLQKEA